MSNRWWALKGSAFRQSGSCQMEALGDNGFVVTELDGDD